MNEAGRSAGEHLTYREAVGWATGYLRRGDVESPRTEARLLLAEATGEEPEVLWLQPDRRLDRAAQSRFCELVERRCRREPLAYIRGRAEFFGRPFLVSPAVLIPRPETELLVEAVLATLADTPDAVVADIGTGSGCIAITLCLERPGICVLAVDLSHEALAVARQNADLHRVAERIDFMQGNLLEPLNRFANPGKLVAIVSNPPYVAAAEWLELAPEVRAYEPRQALVAADAGYAAAERLVRSASSLLLPGGLLALEVGAGQAGRIQNLCAAQDFKAETLRDYAGHERVVLAVKTHPDGEEG